MSEWQSIETAPKEGESILLYAPMDGVTFGSWNDEVRGWQDWTTDFLVSEATHWQPLPAPPSQVWGGRN